MINICIFDFKWSVLIVDIQFYAIQVNLAFMEVWEHLKFLWFFFVLVGDEIWESVSSYSVNGRSRIDLFVFCHFEDVRDEIEDFRFFSVFIATLAVD